MLRSLHDIREAVPTNLTVGIEFAAPALWSLDFSVTCKTRACERLRDDVYRLCVCFQESCEGGSSERCAAYRLTARTSTGIYCCWRGNSARTSFPD